MSTSVDMVLYFDSHDDLGGITVEVDSPVPELLAEFILRLLDGYLESWDSYSHRRPGEAEKLLLKELKKRAKADGIPYSLGTYRRFSKELRQQQDGTSL